MVSRLSREELLTIFNLYQEGYSAREIAERINKLFYPKTRWRKPNQITAIISHYRRKGTIVGYKRGLLKRKQSNEQQSLGKEKIQTEIIRLKAIEDLENENRRLKRMLEDYTEFEKMAERVIEKKIERLRSIAPPLFPPKIFVKVGGSQVAILEISDVHAGKKITPQDYPLGVEYNFRIFKKRLEALSDAILRCSVEQAKARKIERLVINFLGDIVEGEEIYLGQARDVEMNALEQALETAFVFHRLLILPLSSFFKKIDLFCIPGNHGRIGKKGEFHKRSNFDLIFYLFLRSLLSKEERVKIRISSIHSLLYRLKECPAFTHLLLHGDELRSVLTLPYYSLDRVHAHYVDLFGIPIDFLHVAHWHQCAGIQTIRGERIMNGSFIEVVELPTIKKIYLTQPKQLYCGFHPKFGKTWQYTLRLSQTPQVRWDLDEETGTPLFPLNEERFKKGG